MLLLSTGLWDRRSGGPSAQPAGGLQTILFVGCGVWTSCWLGRYSLSQHLGSRRRACGGGGCSAGWSSALRGPGVGSLGHALLQLCPPFTAKSADSLCSLVPRRTSIQNPGLRSSLVATVEFTWWWGASWISSVEVG